MPNSFLPRGHAEELSLELAPEAMRELVDLAMEHIVDHITTLSSQPAGYDVGAPLSLELARTPPAETGRPFAELLDLLFKQAIPPSFNTAGPGYMGYIPGGGLFASAVADLIADATNRYVGVWAAAPLLVEIETAVLRWLAQLIGFADTARGVLLSGGSLATFTAIVTARRERLPEDFLSGILYVSDQAHHAIAKAAMLAGFPARNVVVVPSDHRFRLRLDALARQIAQDRRAGHRPFLIAASAGTTNTGAVDDLDGLADIADAERLWLHVDAAYGGFFLLTDRGRQVMRGIERADSVVLDPHKGMFLPYGTGAVVVKDGPGLRRAHAVHADYMPSLQSEGEAEPRIDFCEHGPELSRSFRGLRVWLPLQLHGVGAFRRSLDEKLDLAARAAERLRAIPGIEIVAAPELSIVAFRFHRAGLEDAAGDELNRRLLQRVLASQRVWITATTLRDRFVLRICVLSFRTHRDRLDECVDIIAATAAELT